ncbi:transcription factor Adf-1 isoform X1 [Drosophila mojavensis]|uniref:Transcription factor Adf-1 isoform X1 n=2 Tax=Drosophila arizonae TaxID=7263 RepID=A0ABM1PHW0_DROAR|nr:PREDICTED: transcription factor Adf-1 isoform X1 [Drosophila arizonae]XP_017962280.1 transcription factor Adf-1 isoform X1 [Drosophila navojoa]XP_032585548.1 transcription factor Adf-1 isoform X1 [Drosophila mojavensis]
MHTLSAAIEMDKLDANLEQQFDLNLIEAVKMNPVIYDRSHYNYKHFVRKAQTWKQIAETLGVSEQKCTKRWKSLRDKFAREMKLCQESRWRYFKQMQFLVDSIRQYRESLLGKCANGSQNANQVADPTQQQQAQQQTVVDIFAQPFNGSATTSAQALTHPHDFPIEITVTGDAQLATAVGKDQKPYFYEPPLKRERGEEEHSDNMLNSIKIFQNNVSQAVSAEDQSFGMVVTDMLNTLGVRQKAEAKVHIIKYLTDMQLLAQHNKY